MRLVKSDKELYSILKTAPCGCNVYYAERYWTRNLAVANRSRSVEYAHMLNVCKRQITSHSRTRNATEAAAGLQPIAAHRHASSLKIAHCRLINSSGTTPNWVRSLVIIT